MRLNHLINYILPGNPDQGAYLDRDCMVYGRFTKAMRGFNELEYSDRLNILASLTLQQRRVYIDMMIVFKSLRGLTNCSASDLGLSLTSSHSRGRSVQLKQRKATSRKCAGRFMYRAPSKWNKLPLNITSFIVLNYIGCIICSLILTQRLMHVGVCKVYVMVIARSKSLIV